MRPHFQPNSPLKQHSVDDLQHPLNPKPIKTTTLENNSMTTKSQPSTPDILFEDLYELACSKWLYIRTTFWTWNWTRNTKPTPHHFTTSRNTNWIPEAIYINNPHRHWNHVGSIRSSLLRIIWRTTPSWQWCFQSSHEQTKENILQSYLKDKA